MSTDTRRIEGAGIVLAAAEARLFPGGVELIRERTAARLAKRATSVREL